MKCSNCGNELLQGDQVCRNCGTPTSTLNTEQNENSINQGQSSVNQNNSGQPSIPQTNINLNLNNQPNISEQPTSNETKVKSKKTVPIIIGVIIALLIIISVLAVLISKKAVPPKTVFEKSIDNITEMILEPLNDEHSKITQEVNFNANIASANGENAELFKIINKFDFSTNSTIDYTSKTISGNFLVNYDKNKLLQGDIYAENNMVYLNLPELYNKYFKLPFEYTEYLNKNGEDIKSAKTILKELSSALKNSFRDDYFTLNKEKLEINDKVIDVNKNQLVINQDNFEIIIKDVFKYLLNSKDFVSAYAKISKVSESEIRQSLEEALNTNYGEFTDDNFIVTITIYTDNHNNFVKFDVNYDNASIAIIKNNDKSYELSVTSKEVNFKTKINITEQGGNNKYAINYDDGQNKINLNIDLKVSYDKNVVKPNITNAVEFDKLSFEEQYEITEKLEKNTAYKQLEKDLINLQFNQLGGLNNLY